MSLVINNNLMAVNATRNLNESYGKLATSTRRLSSGLRVGTAADDAAGLAMRELMRADIQTLGQGLRNANDGISMIQTADGALGVIDAKLIRMKELAEQAATGTYTDAQRKMIDQEYQLMADEITRIAQDTDFNSRKLLAGSGQDIEVEKSVVDDTVASTATKIKADGNTETWGTAGSSNETLSAIDVAFGTQTTDAENVTTFAKPAAAVAAKPFTYTSRSGLVDVVNTVDQATTDAAKIDMNTGEILSGFTGIASTIAATNYAGDTVTIESRAPGGEWADITATVDAGAVTTTAGDEVRITITKADGSVVRDTFENNDNQFTLTSVAAGTDYTIETAAASATSIKVVSEVAATKSFEYTSKTGVTVHNDAVSQFSDGAKATFTHNARTGDLENVSTVASSASSSYGTDSRPVEEFTIETFNVTTNTWEEVSLGSTPGDELDLPESVTKFRITADYGDGQQVRDTFSNNTGGKFTITKDGYGLSLDMTVAGAQDSSTQIQVKSEDLVVVNVHFGSGSQDTDSYDTYINMASAKSLGVGQGAGDNIETQENAKKALDNLTIAITRKDEIRAEIGSTQNRLAATIENVSIQKENLQASESRISDVDVATEMTEFNKVQIMTNAAVSMLAQANSLPKMAQKLLDAR